MLLYRYHLVGFDSVSTTWGFLADLHIYSLVNGLQSFVIIVQECMVVNSFFFKKKALFTVKRLFYGRSIDLIIKIEVKYTSGQLFEKIILNIFDHQRL